MASIAFEKSPITEISPLTWVSTVKYDTDMSACPENSERSYRIARVPVKFVTIPALPAVGAGGVSDGATLPSGGVFDFSGNVRKGTNECHGKTGISDRGSTVFLSKANFVSVRKSRTSSGHV